MNQWYGWVRGLSNWQFVVCAAVVDTLVVVVGDCALALLSRHANLASFTVSEAIFIGGLTAFQARRRWK